MESEAILELVQRVEGFKHVSLENDKEIDEICNFTFSTAELSMHYLCSEDIINTKAVPEPVADCVNNSARKRKRSGYNECTKKRCCKENRAVDMALTPSASSVSKSPVYRNTAHSKRYWDPVTAGGSAMKCKPSTSYQRGGYNNNKYQPCTLSGPVTYGQTPRSEHYQDPVTMEALGRKAYLKRRRQLNKAYQRVK